jgi:broad specificity phosphatase PhoE
VSAVRLVLLRHAETEANRARLIQGQNDSPLTPEGIATTALLAEKLRGPGLGLGFPGAPATWYCSPLERARETLRRVRATLSADGPVRYDARLMEIDFGDLTGRPVLDVLPIIHRHKLESALPYPGGESGADLKRRVLDFLAEATAGDAGGPVLVMTHFGVIETALRHYLAIPLSEPVQPPHEAVHAIDLGPGAPPRLTVL